PCRLKAPPLEDQWVVSLCVSCVRALALMPASKDLWLRGHERRCAEAAHGKRPKGDILLKLRKVEIVGFKSFCDRTVVTFSGSGTTCIVGPNGCGKSNVVDAISWVLGEQSHKSLRAERMADCIFNGTEKRPPLGMAEVTLTMEDPELAEAARFVLDGSAAEAAREAPAVQTLDGVENSAADTDANPQNLSLAPAQAS